MNFFGHLVVARWHEPDPAFGLGAMLPDLLGMCGAKLGDAAPPVAAGIEFHHRTDAVFHQLPAFVALSREARQWLDDAGVPRGPTLAAAHVGVELMLDGALADDGAAVQAYEAALDVDLRWASFVDAARFAGLRRGLRDARIPGSYNEPAAVAKRLTRILARRPRLSLPPDRADAMQRFTAAFNPRIRARAPEVAAQLRESLARR